MVGKAMRPRKPLDTIEELRTAVLIMSYLLWVSLDISKKLYYFLYGHLVQNLAKLWQPTTAEKKSVRNQIQRFLCFLIKRHIQDTK